MTECSICRVAEVTAEGATCKECDEWFVWFDSLSDDEREHELEAMLRLLDYSIGPDV